MDTIQEIKKEMEQHQGESAKITFNGRRNKTEKFEAIIKEIYPFVFIVNIKDTKETKSFSYSDVLTGTIEIYFK